MTIRTVLVREMREVRASLLEMGSLAERAVARSMQALTQHDRSLAQTVIDDDGGINKLRYAIEEQCVTIIATQQPMAGDLREIITTVSIVAELERIADHAKGIARLTHRLDGAPMPPDLAGLPALADDVRSILRNSVDAYVARDEAMARRVVRQDDPIDRRYQAIFQSLILFMGSDPSAHTPATYLLWIAHNLERIGDRATNIAERVVFLVTGQLVELDSDQQAVA
jgi:phosphate transport system protein